MDYENLDFSVLLDVIANIANSASATEAEKYTSITTAYIVSNIDANIYKYKVQDQDSIYEATMLSPNDSPYNANDKVYVLHFGDQDKTKKILGLASAVEKEILTQRAKNQYANKLEFIGESLNFGKGNVAISNLNTFKQELFRQEENSEGVMVQAGGGHFAAAASVSSTIDKNIKCKYGIRIDFLNNGKVVKTFTFDSTEFVGNIYNLKNSYQQKVFSIENIPFTNIEVLVDYKGIEKSLIEFNNITLTPVIPADNSSEDYGAIVKNPSEKGYITGLKEEDKEFITLEAGLTLWKTEIKPTDREADGADIIDYFWFRKNDSINYNSLNYCEYGGEGWECLGSRKEIKILEKEIDENGAETGNWKEAVKGIEWLEMEPTFKVHKGNAPEFENKYKVVIKYHNMILSSEPYTIVNSSKVPYTAIIDDSVYQITTTTEGESGSTVSLTCKVNANNESAVATATYQWYKKRATEDKFDAIDTNDTANKQTLVLRPQDIDVVNDFKCYVKFTGNFNGTVSSNTVTVKDLTDLVNKDTYKEEKQVLYQWVEGLKTPELPSNDVDYATGNLKGWSKTRAAAPNKEGIVYYLNYTERTIIYFQGVLYSKTNWTTPEIIASKDSENSALMEQFNTFRALTADGEKQGTFYTDNKELFINADFINTGTLRVADGDKEIFLATIHEPAVKIAGLEATSTSLSNNNEKNPLLIDSGKSKIVVGNIRLEKENSYIPSTSIVFGVDGSTDTLATAIPKNTEVKYARTESSSIEPGSLPEDGWTLSDPGVDKGLYLWERTKKVYENADLNTTSYKMITGPKGDTGANGAPGTSVYVAEAIINDVLTPLSRGTQLMGTTISTSKELINNFYLEDLGVNPDSSYSFESGQIIFNLTYGKLVFEINGSMKSIYYVSDLSESDRHYIWNYYFSEASEYTFNSSAEISSIECVIQGYRYIDGTYIDFDTTQTSQLALITRALSVLTLNDKTYTPTDYTYGGKIKSVMSNFDIGENGINLKQQNVKVSDFETHMYPDIQNYISKNDLIFVNEINYTDDDNIDFLGKYNGSLTGIGIKSTETIYFVTNSNTIPSINKDYNFIAITSFMTIGYNYAWQCVKTTFTDDSVDPVYNSIVALDQTDAARHAAAALNISLGEWCKDRNVTIVNGSTLITGDIEADQVASSIFMSPNFKEEDENKIDKTPYSVTGFQLFAGVKDNKDIFYLKSPFFAIDEKGQMHAKAGGTIGGWSITDEGLSNGSDTYLKPTEIKVGEIFKATATGGTIGGWNITSKGINSQLEDIVNLTSLRANGGIFFGQLDDNSEMKTDASHVLINHKGFEYYENDSYSFSLKLDGLKMMDITNKQYFTLFHKASVFNFNAPFIGLYGDDINASSHKNNCLYLSGLKYLKTNESGNKIVEKQISPVVLCSPSSSGTRDTVEDIQGSHLFSILLPTFSNGETGNTYIATISSNELGQLIITHVEVFYEQTSI